MAPSTPVPVPFLVLAPMEGITDYPMRKLLTEIGGIDLCVSEFIRVSAHVLPERVVHRLVPESLTGWKTAAGVPVVPQILGGDPAIMAGMAERLEGMGAPQVDLNFGCPAKPVNRHDGGASLLKCPERLLGIVRAVRSALRAIPVTVKIRLGWENPEDVYGIARQAEQGGARWLTVHARTRMDGYTGPAQWRFLTELRQKLSIPLIANGDIASAEDLERCRAETGCEHFMAGRAILRDPWLFRRLRKEPVEENIEGVLLKYLRYGRENPESRGREGGRLKQIVRCLGEKRPAMARLFETLRTARTPDEIDAVLRAFFGATPRRSPPTHPGVLQSA